MKFDPEKLIEVRWSKRMTQRDVARAIGVDSSYICNMEKGRQAPSATTLLKLSDVLMCEPSDFYVKDNSEENNK